MISNEKITVINVIETNPTKKIISAQRSKSSVDRFKRIDENESRALIMKNKLSIAKALSIK